MKSKSQMENDLNRAAGQWVHDMTPTLVAPLERYLERAFLAGAKWAADTITEEVKQICANQSSD